MSSFVEKLDAEALAFFNDVTQKKHSEQAVAFLNAYWDEVGNQAEWIFGVAWAIMKKEEMDSKNISLLHQYEEGNDFDFDIGLKFYESMCKFCEDPKDLRWKNVVDTDDINWSDDKWAISRPHMMTAIKRKKELKEKVDVNFDGRISMLEYLLDIYSDDNLGVNPADFITRSMKAPDEHPEVKKARLALEAVNQRIREYEAEKARLEALAAGTGVKALGAKNMLAQLDSSPLKEELNRALITAEAAVRKVTKLFGSGAAAASGEGGEKQSGPTDGAVWWMEKDLATKKKLYGARKK